jgi:hypothetical protein
MPRPLRPGRTPGIARRAAPLGLAALATLTFSPQVLAQGNSNKPPNTKPATSALSLDARPSPVIFGSVSSVSGKLTGSVKVGTLVRLEADATAPYGDSYKLTTLTTTTKANGDYSFAVKPLVNTSYRALAQTSPNIRSTARMVNVRSLVGVRLSDSTPRRGSLVRFSGSIFPAHDGTRAQIQRRTSTGGWATVARPMLADAGTDHSTYTRRIRISRNGVYRVKVPGDGDHVNGFSRTRTITVH